MKNTSSYAHKFLLYWFCCWGFGSLAAQSPRGLYYRADSVDIYANAGSVEEPIHSTQRILLYTRLFIMPRYRLAICFTDTSHNEWDYWSHYQKNRDSFRLSPLYHLDTLGYLCHCNHEPIDLEDFNASFIKIREQNGLYLSEINHTFFFLQDGHWQEMVWDSIYVPTPPIDSIRFQIEFEDKTRIYQIPVSNKRCRRYSITLNYSSFDYIARQGMMPSFEKESVIFPTFTRLSRKTLLLHYKGQSYPLQKLTLIDRIALARPSQEYLEKAIIYPTKEKSFLYKLLRRGLEIKRKYRNRLARLKKWNIVVPLKTNIP